MAEFLSSREVARYLRLNPKKIYALVAAGQLPAARISGKWLFPKELVDRWVAEHTVYPPGGVLEPLLDRLLVLQGSDDWLLSRVVDRVQASLGAAVPTATVGSLAGLEALAQGRAHVASCHVDPEDARPYVTSPTWRVGLFSREQGILLDRRRTRRLDGLAALCRKGLRVAERQPRSGTARLVERLLAREGLSPGWTPVGPFASHLELALAIRNGRADAGVGIRAAAALTGLDFVPLAQERFELAVPATFLSHPRVARFLELVVEELGAEASEAPPGYAFDGLGRLARFAGEGAGATGRQEPTLPVPSRAVPRAAGRPPPKPPRSPRKEHR
jgi:excisionase family DNA binding protein